MAASPLQLDFGLTYPALTTSLPSISAVRHMRGLEPVIVKIAVLSYSAGRMVWPNGQAESGEAGMPADDLQESLWLYFFGDPTHWWDNRRSKKTPQNSEVFLWQNNQHNPALVELELAALDSGMKTAPESSVISVENHCDTERYPAHEAPLEITCRKLCKNGRISDAVDALNLRVEQGCHVDIDLFYLTLKKCIAQNELVMGRRIHALSIKSGYGGDAFLATHLISLYASHGRLEEAMQVFTKVSIPSIYNWTTIIFAYSAHGGAAQAIRLYQNMLQSTTIRPDNRLYVAVLKACASARDLVAGKEVHAHILALPGRPDIFVQAGLVSMYAKCGSLEDARRVFDQLRGRDVVAWNAMISGYAQQGMGQEALSLYRGMQQEGLTPPNAVTYVCLLKACASVGVTALDQGKQLHAEIEERGLQEDLVLGGSLVNMYAKCGSLGDAHRVFDKLPKRHVVTWTALIAGYTQQGMVQQALSLYNSMQHEGLTPNSVTYQCLLQACACVGLGAIGQGKQLHAEIEERGLQEDLVLGGSLVNMYAKCGSLHDARRVFDRLPERNVVIWNALLAGYVQQGMGQEALNVYCSMQQEGLTYPDTFTYACLLQACASVGVGGVDQGKQLHAQIEEKGLQDDLVLGGILVDMYAKCGSLLDARRVFDSLREKDVVTWTVLISGYTQQGLGQDALSLYRHMQQEGNTAPDSVTYVCLLQACAFVAALPLGKQLHAQIEDSGLQGNVAVGAGLVNMYAKCGSMFDSQLVFDSLPERSIDVWNALTSGYSRQGESEVVFDLFDRMRLEGRQPDGVTFLCLLSVCSHVGQVDKGRKYFEAMELDYGISPTIEHYTCMTDLLGRAGHLEEAAQMAKTMPFPPSGVVWLTLLGACRKWKNVEIGEQAFQFAVTEDGQNAACYVLMSNIYASAQMWEEAKQMQARRRKCGAWKEPGQSWWTDMGGVVHTFVVGDKKHPESAGIYARLQQLIPKLKKAGYIPNLDSSLRDISDDEKEAELCGHSEKLAIAYALNKTPDGTTIRVVKNLRVCEDCHSATAYISKVEERTIICRDASRFHVYKDGKCSCGDYW